MKTKDIVNIGNGTASYNVLVLGNDFIRTVYASLPATPLIPLSFTYNGSRGHRFAPTALYERTCFAL